MLLVKFIYKDKTFAELKFNTEIKKNRPFLLNYITRGFLVINIRCSIKIRIWVFMLVVFFF